MQNVKWILVLNAFNTNVLGLEIKYPTRSELLALNESNNLNSMGNEESINEKINYENKQANDIGIIKSNNSSSVSSSKEKEYQILKNIGPDDKYDNFSLSATRNQKYQIKANEDKASNFSFSTSSGTRASTQENNAQIMPTSNYHVNMKRKSSNPTISSQSNYKGKNKTLKSNRPFNSRTLDISSEDESEIIDKRNTKKNDFKNRKSTIIGLIVNENKNIANNTRNESESNNYKLSKQQNHENGLAIKREDIRDSSEDSDSSENENNRINPMEMDNKLNNRINPMNYKGENNELKKISFKKSKRGFVNENYKRATEEPNKETQNNQKETKRKERRTENYVEKLKRKREQLLTMLSQLSEDDREDSEEYKREMKAKKDEELYRTLYEILRDYRSKGKHKSIEKIEKNPEII